MTSGPPGNATRSPGVWARLRQKWGVSNRDVFFILLTFAVTGMTALKLAKPLVNQILPPDIPRWLWWTLRILIVVPIYEVMLVGFGTIFGQRRFFWNKQKAMFGRIFRPFSPR